MKTLSKTLCCTLAVALFAGCAATRPIGDAAFGAGGAYLGHELSGGDPLATAAGAAGGVLLSEGLHYAAGKQAEKAYATGYDKGKSDAVKQAVLALCLHATPAQPGRQRPALPRATAGTAN